MTVLAGPVLVTVLVTVLVLFAAGCTSDHRSNAAGRSEGGPTAGATRGNPCGERPTSSNTGARGTPSASSTTVLKDDDELHDVRVSGLTIEGENVTVRDVVVDGYVLVTGDHAELTHVTAQGIGVSSASHVTIRYADIGGGSADGIQVTSDRGRLVRDVVLDHNFVHDPRPGPYDHYDGTQVRGVDGLRITCSSYVAGSFRPQYNSAVYLEDANGGDADVVIANNWFDGSGYVLRIEAPDTTVTGNRIGADVEYGACLLGDGLTAADVTERDNRGTDGRPATLCAPS